MPVVITVDGSPGPVLNKLPASPAETVTLGVVTPADVSAYAWSLVDVPPGSMAVLSDPVAAAPTFNLDTVGSYLVRLVATLTTGGTATAETVVGVLNPKFYDPVRIPAFLEALQAGSRGWATAVERDIRVLADMCLTGAAFPCFNRSGGPIPFGSVVKITGFENVVVGSSMGATFRAAQVAMASSADGVDEVYGIVAPTQDSMTGSDFAENERWFVVVNGPVWGVRAAHALTAGLEVSRTATPGVMDLGAGAVVGYGLGGTDMFIGVPAGRGGSSGGGGVGGGVLQGRAGGSMDLVVPPGEYDNGAELVPIGNRYATAGVIGTTVTITRPVTTGAMVIPNQILPGAAACSYLSIRKADGVLVQREGTIEGYGDTLEANKTGGGAGAGDLAPDGRAFLCRFIEAVPSGKVVEGIALKTATANMNTIQVAACEDDGTGKPNLATLVVLGNPLAGSDPMNPDYIILRGLSYPVVAGKVWFLFIFGGAIPEPGRNVPGLLLPNDYIKAGWSWDSLIYTDDGGATTFPFGGGINLYDMEVMFHDDASVPAYPAADPLYEDAIKVGTPSYPICVNDHGRDTSKLLVVTESEAAGGGFATDEAPVIWQGV